MRGKRPGTKRMDATPTGNRKKSKHRGNQDKHVPSPLRKKEGQGQDAKTTADGFDSNGRGRKKQHL